MDSMNEKLNTGMLHSANNSINRVISHALADELSTVKYEHRVY
jgi:hypothetical protein